MSTTRTHKRRLLRKVDSALDGALGTLGAQLNIVQSAIQSPMKAIVGMVAGGSVWRGNGANKFVDMINSQFLPLAQLGGNHIDMTAQRLRRAKELVDEADAKAHHRVKHMNWFDFH